MPAPFVVKSKIMYKLMIFHGGKSECRILTRINDNNPGSCRTGSIQTASRIYFQYQTFHPSVKKNEIILTPL
jgi:hypothetical protein